jgi:tRNA G18 (ribose-2'-O)-methylase SpoU
MTDIPEPDLRNVQDRFKGWVEDLIKNELRTTLTGIDVLMVNIEQDFNFGSLVRSCNNFGVGSVYYIGPRKWDRRGSVGTHHYTDVVHLGTTIEECLDFFTHCNYNIVMLETNIDTPSIGPLATFSWPERPLLVVGSESQGIPTDLFLYAYHTVEIPSFGSTRSLNVASAASIALYDYVSKMMYQPEPIPASIGE